MVLSRLTPYHALVIRPHTGFSWIPFSDRNARFYVPATTTLGVESTDMFCSTMRQSPLIPSKCLATQGKQKVVLELGEIVRFRLANIHPVVLIGSKHGDTFDTLTPQSVQVVGDQPNYTTAMRSP